MQITYILIGLVVIWLITLTVLFIWIYTFFNKLTDKVKGGNLNEVLKKVLEVEEVNSKDILLIKKEVIRIEKEGFLHLQKLALLRFNPFGEVGGDHSFSLAILDGQNTGIILTGLHARDRTRMYVKPVKKGKSKLELSKEETKVLETARKSKEAVF